MGLECRCTLTVGRRSWSGRAHLETASLLFRAEGKRLEIPFRSITDATARGPLLRVTHEGGTADFSLERSADRWAAKIRNPPTLLDKLGVKEGHRVSVLGVDDRTFLAALERRAGKVSRRLLRENDLVIFGVESPAALTRLGALRSAIRPNGAIWVVHRKGKAASLRDVDVFRAAREAGLVDTKVASVSDTHTAERLVIPVAQRPSA